MLALKTPLPITFRINGGGLHAARLRQKLETDFMAQFAEGEALVVSAAAAHAEARAQLPSWRILLRTPDQP